MVLMSYPIQHIATLINATLSGDDSLVISGVAPLHAAKSGDLTFFLSDVYRKDLPKSKASALIVHPKNREHCQGTLLITENVEYAFAQVAALFDTFEKPTPSIHPTAIIDPSALIDAEVYIGPHCVIGKRAHVQKNTTLLAHVIVGDDSQIGENTLLHPRVTLAHQVFIGNRVIIHSGAVIGADGFGLTQTKNGWHKIPQIGGVRIEDDVEIGANTCIDRGALTDTLIHRGVKIDNLVQVAHNVEIGENTVIAGCTGIAGSARIGKNCVIAGAVNISGHISICDQAVITGTAMVTHSITEPGIYSSGTGLFSNKAWRKMAVRLRQLDQFMKKEKAKTDV